MRSRRAIAARPGRYRVQPARLLASLYRVRRQVIRLGGYQGIESASPGARQQELGPAAEILMNRIDAIQSRLSALADHVRTRPDLRELDEKIAQARQEKRPAIGSQDFQKAAHPKNSEQQPITGKDAREQQRKAGHPDPPSLADMIRQLSDEIEQLRGLLRQQGTKPEGGTA